MDAFDIFCQIARGAVFSGRKDPPKAMPTIKQESKNPIKTEKVPVIESDESKAEKIEFLSFSDFEDREEKCESKPAACKTVLTDTERINLLRRANKISVIGKNVPPPIIAFEELETDYKFSQRLLTNITSRHETPTPIQMQAIPIMHSGRALMACAPTGSGKTIAYLAPIINDLKAPKKDGIRAIILAPTRELAKQIYRECVRLSEKTALKIHIISKVTQPEMMPAQKTPKCYDILISTPNRVRFLLQQKPSGLDLSKVDWVVIDEADRMLEDSNNSFKEQFVDILAACPKPNKKMALFSATYTVPVSKWALRNLKGLIRVTVGQQNSAVESVKQELLFVGSEAGKLIAVRDLVRTGLKPPVLIFVQSKDRAKQLFDELLYDGINVDVIHSDRTQQQRDKVVKAFREGKIWVLICTELLARGIDFKGVNLVINYDFPPSTISYIHRIGRTGRAGRLGHAITFFTQNDTPNLRDIAQVIKDSGGQVPEYMLKLKKTKKSLKKQLLNSAPKRDVISTDPTFEERRAKKLNRVGQFVKPPPCEDSDISTLPSSIDPSRKKKIKVINEILKHNSASSKPKSKNKKPVKKTKRVTVH